MESYRGFPLTELEIGKFDGVRSVLEAYLNKDTDTTIYISIKAASGKAKIVLVKPNSDVEVLKEVISEKDTSSYDGNIDIHCTSGINKLKIVGENYSGIFKIDQPNGAIFSEINKNEFLEKNLDDNQGNSFSSNFPFG